MDLNNKVTCLILAGGQGSRLYPLTQKRSKPAVPIGGKFRLIDIPVSNCLHSGIRHIWILTQFISESLHRHISTSYRLDPYSRGFISVLAASQGVENKSWYQGTADAVRKNLSYLQDAYDHVMILSGDHLYRMDYSQFIRFHLDNDADISMSVIPVDRERVPELGIMKVDEDNLVTDFIEKPKDESTIDQFLAPESMLNEPHSSGKTHLASMGIYIFKKEVIFDLMKNFDHEDFGSEVIPHAIKTMKVVAYPYQDYWEDIGTIRSFFDAHISMTRAVPEFNFYDPIKPIYTGANFLPAAKVNGANIVSSLVSEGSIIDTSQIHDSVIGVRSIIRKNCTLDRVIMMGADSYETKEEQSVQGEPAMGLGENCVVKNAILDKNVKIGNNVRLINKDEIKEGEIDGIVIRDGIIVVPKGYIIPDNFIL